MVKKIIDISSPRGLKRKEVREVKEFYPEKKHETKVSSPRRRLPRRLGKKIFFISLILIIAGMAAYFSLSQANIEIWPEIEVKTFETKVTVDRKIGNIDLSANLIPGTIFEEARNFSQEFNSSGKKTLEKNAEGVIRVFNDYHLDQILIAQTRFQPPSDKFRPSLERGENPWFRTVERVVVPAKSHIDVKVVADAPGEKYNIEPSDFSIPGLAGTSQYTAIYGRSSEAMKGGFKKEVPEVTQEDLDRAEKVLKEVALKEIKDILKNKIPTGFTIAEDSFETEILEIFSLAEAGSELEKFIFQVKAGARAISFREEDLNNFSKNFITSEISADKEFEQKSLKMEYFSEDISLEEEKITLSLNLEVKTYSSVDKNYLRRGLAGKSLNETQLFLQNQPEFIQSQVRLWPFWVNRVPDNLEKIKIELRVD